MEDVIVHIATPILSTHHINGLVASWPTVINLTKSGGSRPADYSLN